MASVKSKPAEEATGGLGPAEGGAARGSHARSRKKDLRLKETLGGGWTARLAEAAVVGSPDLLSPSIVLITLSKDDETRRVRLDLGKGMFLDATPKGIGSDEGSRLAQSVSRLLIPGGRSSGW